MAAISSECERSWDASRALSSIIFCLSAPNLPISTFSWATRQASDEASAFDLSTSSERMAGIASLLMYTVDPKSRDIAFFDFRKPSTDGSSANEPALNVNSLTCDNFILSCADSLKRPKRKISLHNEKYVR